MVYLIESLHLIKVYLKALKFKDSLRLVLRTVKLSNPLLPKFLLACMHPRFDFPPEVTLKVRVPRKVKITNVLDGEKELDRDKWHVAERFMILALSFEKPLKEIRILTGS